MGAYINSANQEVEKRSTYDDSVYKNSLKQYVEDLPILHSSFRDQARALLINQKISSAFSVINQKGVRGIAHCKVEEYSIDVLKAYLFKMKSIHQSIGYVQKLSVHSLKVNKETYSYYLKPSMKLQTTLPAEQLYGNITLELHLENSIPKKLKCMSTYYSDANYKVVRDIEEWLNVIFLNEQFNL